MAEVAINQRIVPGAPPPAPLSKSQRKKRKTTTKGKTDTEDPATPEVSEAHLTPVPEKAAALNPKDGSVLNDAGTAESITLEDEFELKPSPIVDLIHKRLKATTKKIVSTVLILFVDDHC